MLNGQVLQSRRNPSSHLQLHEDDVAVAQTLKSNSSKSFVQGTALGVIFGVSSFEIDASPRPCR